MKEIIAQYCKILRLSGNIANNFEKIDSSSTGEFLEKLLRLEIEHRETTRKNRLIKQAGFYTKKTFQDYEFENIQIPAGICIDELKETGFINEKRNLIFYGAVGTGKTHLATAIGINACIQGKRVKFFRTASLVNQLSDAKRTGELTKFMRQFNKLDLLICDEWGYVPLEKEGAQLLFQIISDCYEKKSVIITTNLEFSKWVNVFYDEQMTAAMLDRMIHYSHLFIFKGESYRVKHSLMRQKN